MCACVEAICQRRGVGVCTWMSGERGGECMERWMMGVVAQVVISMDFYMCPGCLYLPLEGACVCTSYVRTDDMPNYELMDFYSNFGSNPLMID